MHITEDTSAHVPHKRLLYFSMNTMGQILRNWRITSAALFAVVVIGGAYVFAHGIGSPPVAEASAETALLQAIASKDSDGDGLPNWEESLYGTDPNNLDTFHLGMTDGEAVQKGLIVPKAIAVIPVATSTASTNTDGVDYAADGLTPPTEGTLTDTFAQSFMQLYLSAKAANNGADLTDDQTNALAEQSMTQFIQNFVPVSDFKTAADIKVLGTGPDALRAFASAAEAVLKKNSTVTMTKSELEYLEDAVQNNDSDALDHLTALAKAYQDTAAGLAALPVPQELATDGLAIINATMRLGKIDADFARVNSDPLVTMLALQQFQETELAAESAFTNLASVYADSGVVIPNGTPGASFVNIMANLGARQQAAQTP